MVDRLLIKLNYKNLSILALFVTIVFAPILASAQSSSEEDKNTHRAKVIEIVAEEKRLIPGTDTEHLFQSVTAKILSGPMKDQTITIENDYLELDKNDRFYFKHITYDDGSEHFEVVNIDRINSLILLIAIFIGIIITFGKWQGVRSLVALFGSFLAIIFVLLPGILNGWNPLFASFLVAGGILFLGIFFTHGFNRESAIAYCGTMIAVLLAGLFAVFAVHITDLSGFTSDETIYLNFNTGGSINFTALLLGAFIIGFLGVLDDIAVTQAAVVSELFNSNPNMSRRDVYNRAMRVGREHVGALVNTLVLAYTGASLPILLYFSTDSASFVDTINLEIFATEIVRTIVGSTGLILTVPIVTWLAVIYLRGYKPKHTHSHGHTHGHTHTH